MNIVRQIDEDRPEPLLLTVDDYRILADAGAFDERPRVELIEGVILTVNSERRWHTRVKSELALRLSLKLRELNLRLVAEIEGTVALSEHDAPDPDIILAGESSFDDYIPLGAVALVIEISDSTARFDLGRKKQLYATHAVPEYWVVTRKLIHRFWSSPNGEFQHSDKRSFGKRIESATIPGVGVETSGII